MIEILHKTIRLFLLIIVFFCFTSTPAFAECTFDIKPNSGTTAGPFVVSGTCTPEHRGQLVYVVKHPTTRFITRAFIPNSDTGEFELHIENFATQEQLGWFASPTQLTFEMSTLQSQILGSKTFTITSAAPLQCGVYGRYCPDSCPSISHADGNDTCGPLVAPTNPPPPASCQFIPPITIVRVAGTSNQYDIAGNIGIDGLAPYPGSYLITADGILQSQTLNILPDEPRPIEPSFYNIRITAEPGDRPVIYMPLLGCKAFCSHICSTTVDIVLNQPTGLPSTTPIALTPKPTYSTPAPIRSPSPTGSNSGSGAGGSFIPQGCADTNNDGKISGGEGVQTAIGCFKGDLSSTFAILFGTAIGMAGGIAFLLIIFGGLKIMLSSGNPEAMNEGKEIVSSAISGLLLIVFSVFILRFIGVDILRIPGFS